MQEEVQAAVAAQEPLRHTHGQGKRRRKLPFIIVNHSRGGAQ